MRVGNYYLIKAEIFETLFKELDKNSIENEPTQNSHFKSK